MVLHKASSGALRLEVAKANLCLPPPPLAVKWGEEGLEWTPTHVRLQRTPLDRAEEMLRRELRGGARLLTDIVNLGRAAALGIRTLYRAQDSMGLLIQDRQGKVWWALPEDDRGPPQPTLNGLETSSEPLTRPDEPVEQAEPAAPPQGALFEPDAAPEAEPEPDA